MGLNTNSGSNWDGTGSGTNHDEGRSDSGNSPGGNGGGSNSNMGPDPAKDPDWGKTTEDRAGADKYGRDTSH